MLREKQLEKLLRRHRADERAHFQVASVFLTRCQVLSPHVERGSLRGVVCPWEIEDTSPTTHPILEDFHDTLEAIWVWSHHRRLSDDGKFDENIRQAWRYIFRNLGRFEPLQPYDASHVLLALIEDDRWSRQDKTLGTKATSALRSYLKKLGEYDGREYHDPFWMLFALARFAAARDDKALSTFVMATLNRWKREGAFRLMPLAEEPKDVGPGGHDFFSSNANKVLAVAEVLGPRPKANAWLESDAIPNLVNGFVRREADENAWNANVAAAMAAAYNISRSPIFLEEYFAIMHELRKRDTFGVCSLPRQPGSYRDNESWVTFFWSFAYAEACRLPQSNG